MYVILDPASYEDTSAQEVPKGRVVLGPVHTVDLDWGALTIYDADEQNVVVASAVKGALQNIDGEFPEDAVGWMLTATAPELKHLVNRTYARVYVVNQADHWLTADDVVVVNPFKKEDKVRYRVTERQVIYYTWEVDAGSEEEARDSAVDGVPDDAHEKLMDSEVTAEVMT